MADINRIINGYNNATDAANYGEALKLEMEQVDGSDYKMIWTSAYDGDYPPRGEE